MSIRQNINNAATIKNFKGQFIIASIDKVTGAMSLSANPVAHPIHGEALTEATRLAKITPSKKFVVLTIGTIASIQDVIFE
jgi:hypothetical protein